tara:strand:+ start:8139 stop:8291 length:153 start_codon:yes stop_codon:yes gene_type:complete
MIIAISIGIIVLIQVLIGYFIVSMHIANKKLAKQIRENEIKIQKNPNEKN